MENYVEFENEGVRFALSTHDVLAQATGFGEYTTQKHGHNLELAFSAESTKDVDATYAELLVKGAKGIKEPTDMPWGQRTAFFSDPDGNVHEIFAEISKKQ